MFKPAPKAFRAGFNCGVHSQSRKPSGFQSRGCCIESKKTGFGRESRIQRWRFLAVPPGAAPQADNQRRAFGAEHIRQRGRQAWRAIPSSVFETPTRGGVAKTRHLEKKLNIFFLRLDMEDCGDKVELHFVVLEEQKHNTQLWRLDMESLLGAPGQPRSARL